MCGSDERLKRYAFVLAYATIFCQLCAVNLRDLRGNRFRTLSVYFAGMPDEVLGEFISILPFHNKTSSLDDITQILNQFLPIGRQLVDVNRLRISQVRQRLVDLSVVRHATLAKGLDYAVQLNLHIIDKILWQG